MSDAKIYENSLLVPLEWRAVRNPWLQDRELAKALILRAAILWSYSHIEQKLTDFMVRCASMPAYRGLAEKPPFRMKGRVSYLRRVFDAEGPFSQKKSIGIAILDRYDAGRDIRNQMAHADIEVYPEWGTVLDEILIDGTSIHHGRERYWGGRLEQEAKRASRFSKAVQRIHYSLFGDEPLIGDPSS